MPRRSRAAARPSSSSLTTALALLAACSASRGVPAGFAEALAEAPEDAAARLVLEGDRITTAAAGVGRTALPEAVRTTIEAVAPRGELLFAGLEWGPRGEGFRVDKRYTHGTPHVRTVLVAPDGRVLERGHSVPIAQVPQAVLAIALRMAPLVDEAMIVSGAEVEEFWRCTVRDRAGRTFVATVGLDGRLLGRARRLRAQVDAR
jgi:hypothetical protein